LESKKIGFTIFGSLQDFILNLQFAAEINLETHLEKGKG
jgi:hypothetical protein